VPRAHAIRGSVGTDHDVGAGVMRGARRGCNQRPPAGRRSRRRTRNSVPLRPSQSETLESASSAQIVRDGVARPGLSTLSGLARGRGAAARKRPEVGVGTAI
jgi:hypothetical protein